MVMTTEQRISAIENAVKMAGLAGKDVLTFEEAATYTGLSKSYLYKLTCAKKIPFYKPSGKLVFFERKELETWLRSNRISSAQEIQDKAMKALPQK